MSYIDLVDELRAANEAIENLDNHLMENLTATPGGEISNTSIEQMRSIATYLCNVAMYEGTAVDVNSATIEQLRDYIRAGIYKLIPSYYKVDAPVRLHNSLLSNAGAPKHSKLAKIIERSKFPFTTERDCHEQSIVPYSKTYAASSNPNTCNAQATFILYNELRARQRELNKPLFASAASIDNEDSAPDYSELEKLNAVQQLELIRTSILDAPTDMRESIRAKLCDLMAATYITPK